MSDVRGTPVEVKGGVERDVTIAWHKAVELLEQVPSSSCFQASGDTRVLRS